MWTSWGNALDMGFYGGKCPIFVVIRVARVGKKCGQVIHWVRIVYGKLKCLFPYMGILASDPPVFSPGRNFGSICFFH